MLLSVLLTAMLSSSGQKNSFDIEPSELIRLVQDNERLYENVEVRYRIETIQTRTFPLGPPDSVLASNVHEFHSVVKGPRYRVDHIQLGKTPTGKELNHNMQHSYDGKHTRKKAGGVFNLSDSHNEVDGVYRPHSFAYCTDMIMPFSVLLQGNEYIDRHPGVFWCKNGDSKILTIKKETISNLECYCITCQLYGLKPTKVPVCRLVVWLAIDRNLLPVKIQTYLDEWAGVQKTLGEVTEFEELEKGVWIPKKIQYIYYDQTESKGDKLVIDHRREVTVDEITLSPRVSDDYFRDIWPDDNMPAHIIKNGVVTQSMSGKEYNQSKEYGKKSRFQGYIWLALLVVGLLVLIYLYRRSYRMKAAV